MALADDRALDVRRQPVERILEPGRLLFGHCHTGSSSRRLWAASVDRLFCHRHSATTSPARGSSRRLHPCR
ncbi:hypothetical protein ACFPRL_08835 [Pseudoclavibacter helvolus]